MDKKEVLRYVINGFELIPAKFGFSNSYTTKTGKATKELSNIINDRIKKNFPQTRIKTSFDPIYKTINFYRAMMEHLVMENIIRLLLSEAEYTSLGIGSFRGSSHTGRTDKFVDYLANNTPIPLKKGESVTIEKVQIIKKAAKEAKGNDSKKEKNNDPEERGTTYQVNNSSDMEALKAELPYLGAGDQLFLYDTAKVKHSISTVAKTPELGGKGKGYQRGSQAEATEIVNIQKQIDEFNKDGEGITIVGVGPNIVSIQPVTGMQKADFKFVNKAGNILGYIQHKSPKHQQMAGVGRKPFTEFKEVQEFAQKIYDLVQKSPDKRLEKPEYSTIQDPELKRLAVYGEQEEGPRGVQFYCIGPMELKSVSDNSFELTVPKEKGRVYTGNQIPEGDEAPTLVATYRAGRNQKVPGTKLVIPDIRLGIYPKNYINRL